MLIGLVVFAIARRRAALRRIPCMLNLARGAQGVGGAFLLTASLRFSRTPSPARNARERLRVLGREPRHSAGSRPDHRRRDHEFFRMALGASLSTSPSAPPGRGDLKFIASLAIPTPSSSTSLGTVTFSAGLALLIWALIDGNDEGWTSVHLCSA